MANTVRTESELLNIFQSRKPNGINAQNLRDFVVSCNLDVVQDWVNNGLIQGLSGNRALVSSDSGNDIFASSVTTTELNYLSGVTSAVQTQIDGKQPTITGGATSITSSNLTASRALVSDGSGKVSASSVTSTELGYVSGVSSAIQTQIDGKQPTITGGATSITSSNLTASRALVSDGSGKVSASSVTTTEVGYLSGVTSAVQTQIDAKVTGAATDFVTLSPNSDTRNVIQATAGTVKPLVIKGASGQSDWLTLWQDNSNTTLVYITSNGQIASVLSTGTAPFSVNSTTKVTNLNADLIDGYSSGDFVLITSPYANLQQYDNGNVSGSFAYNYANGRQQTAKLTGTTALSITNGGNCSAPAVLIIDNTEGQSLSFSGSFKWAGGTEPSLGTGIHVLILIYDNKSSSYLCNVSQSYS